MQNKAVLIGGFEYGYMQKLAIYLTNREPRIVVGILEDPEDYESYEEEVLWVGSEAFITRLLKEWPESNYLILSEQKEDENRILRYQSGEKIYQEISLRLFPQEIRAESGEKKWIMITGDVTQTELLAYSMTYAQLLGKTSRVLYLNLSEWCPMEYLLGMEPGRNLGDLVVELRCAEHKGPEPASYLRRLEQVDYLTPIANPMILHELKISDLEGLIAFIQTKMAYDWVVLAAGNTCNGFRQLVKLADRILHISNNDLLHEGSRRDWQRFLERCQEGCEEKVPVQILWMPELKLENTGIYLLYEWINGPFGQAISAHTEARRGTE